MANEKQKELLKEMDLKTLRIVKANLRTMFLKCLEELRKTEYDDVKFGYSQGLYNAFQFVSKLVKDKEEN